MVVSSEKNHSSEYRYERKFFIQNIDSRAVEKVLLSHPAFFKEIHHERYINNIYFDFVNFNNFMDNIDGNTDRLKYRVRWYGQLFVEIEKPVLELKIKKGLVGTKRNYVLNSFELKKGITSGQIKNVLHESDIDPKVKFAINEQIPVLLNRYKRRYFESNDKKFRITIDSEQSFYKISKFQNNFIQCYKDNNNVILELKYNHADEIEAKNIVQHIPFQLTKSSKYSRGVQLFYM